MGYSDGKTAEAIEKAEELRASGRVVELALSSQTEAEARRCQKDLGYGELVYVS